MPGSFSTRLLGFLGLASLALALAAFYFSAGKSISIRDAGQTRTVTTHTGSVGAVLDEAGIALYPEDRVRPPLDSPVSDGLGITVERSFEIQVEESGKTVIRRAVGDSMAEILASLQISLGSGDAVIADGRRLSPDQLALPLAARPQQIVILRSVPFTVVEAGAARSYSATAETVEDALKQVGLTLYLGDQISPPRDARLTPGLTITLQRSQSITIQVDGSTLKTRVPPASRTVGEALAGVGVTLSGLDYSVPGADEPLPPGGVIVVNRVTEQFITATEPIPFDTVYQARPDLELDSTLLVQEGQNGVLERRLRVRYENGVEVGRAPDSERVIQAATDRIIGYGTNIVIRTLDTPDGPVQYWRKIFVRVTSYSPARSGTSPTAPWYGRTRTGRQLAKGMAAVDPTVIALGTKFYVIGYGFGSAEDTGGGVRGKWLDLGYSDEDFETWRGYTDLYLLAPAPPADRIVWMLPEK